MKSLRSKLELLLHHTGHIDRLFKKKLISLTIEDKNYIDEQIDGQTQDDSKSSETT